MQYHKDKNGELTPLNQLKNSHLCNIIKCLERMAKEGVRVKFGGGTCVESYWYDEEIIYGKRALDHLGYDKYILEKTRRDKAKTKQIIEAI